MALIKCPECQREISDQSKSCPYCGYQLHRMSADEKSKIKKSVVGIVTIIAVIVLAVIIYDACTVSTEELRENLNKSKQELQDIRDEIADLEEQKRKNDWLINYYESRSK